MTRSFDLRFRYTDDVLCLNNPSFGDLMHRICLKGLVIRDAADIVGLASYLDLHLEIDGKGRLLTKLYDKRGEFSFRIFDFPFICGGIPSAPACGVFCHNSCVVPELAETAQAFCTALEL